jgi:hypothetical protein
MACSRLALAALLLVASAALAAATKKTRCYLEPMATPVTIEAGDMGHLTFIAKGLKKASCSGMATLVATSECNHSTQMATRGLKDAAARRLACSTYMDWVCASKCQ